MENLDEKYADTDRELLKYHYAEGGPKLMGSISKGYSETIEDMMKTIFEMLDF